MSTFANQNNLPFLPVPSLDDTIKTYLETVQPFLSESDFQKTRILVEEFQSKEGPKLQERLLARYDTARTAHWEPQYEEISDNILEESIGNKSGEVSVTKSSWLIDWWNEYSYLRYREPLVLNVSFFFVFPARPVSASERAAGIILHALNFKELLVEQQLSPDTMRGSAMCMNQYHFLFNSCRVPRTESDQIKIYDPRKHNHIVILKKNLFYKIDPYEFGPKATLGEIKRVLEEIISDTENSSSEPDLGVFTADHRDNWSRNFVKIYTQNKDAVTDILSSSFILCLDESSPVTREEIAHHCWHGYGQNRWFDKTLQFIVFENGKAGFLGEHSMMDATSPARLCDFICEREANHKNTDTEPSFDKTLSLKKLQLILDESLILGIDTILKKLEVEIAKHDVQCVNYTKFGKGFIKSQSMSPDSFIQVAIQLAYFKLMGTFAATYETAGMRKFCWGRTETCRSVSSSSVLFCHSMEDPSFSDFDRQFLAKDAVKAHSNYMTKCLAGKGIDRHFLGLRLSIKKGESVPSLFLDPIFNLSCHWILSTSQIPSEYFEGYGWGEVVSDGFGVAYMVREDRIMFNITGLIGDSVPHLFEHKIHETEEGPMRKSYFVDHYKIMRVKWLKSYLEESLDEMYRIFATTDKPSTIDKVAEKKLNRIGSRSISNISKIAAPLVSESTQTNNSGPSSNGSIEKIGMSLAYPKRDLEGVVGEDVGLIEFFEMDLGQKQLTNSSSSIGGRIVKRFAWPWVHFSK